MTDLVERLLGEHEGWKDDPLGQYQAELFYRAAQRIAELEKENNHRKKVCNERHQRIAELECVIEQMAEQTKNCPMCGGGGE